MSQNLHDISYLLARPLLQVRVTLALSPSLAMASQSFLDCSDAAGLVSSI